MKKRRKHQTAQPKQEPEPEVISFPGSGRVEVGDIVVRRPVSFSNSDSKNAQLMRGTVVWVHPKGRFHVVEFDKGIRESFAGVTK